MSSTPSSPCFVNVVKHPYWPCRRNRNLRQDADTLHGRRTYHVLSTWIPSHRAEKLEITALGSSVEQIIPSSAMLPASDFPFGGIEAFVQEVPTTKTKDARRAYNAQEHSPARVQSRISLTVWSNTRTIILIWRTCRPNRSTLLQATMKPAMSMQRPKRRRIGSSMVVRRLVRPRSGTCVDSTISSCQLSRLSTSSSTLIEGT